MAIAVVARARASFPNPAGKLSAASGGSVGVTVSGVDALETTYVAVKAVVGGPPATYADMGAGFGFLIPGLDADQTIRWDQSGSTFTAVFNVADAGGTFAEEDEVWVAVFGSVATVPGPTDAPLATSGPFTVLA